MHASDIIACHSKNSDFHARRRFLRAGLVVLVLDRNQTVPSAPARTRICKDVSDFLLQKVLIDGRISDARFCDTSRQMIH